MRQLVFNAKIPTTRDSEIERLMQHAKLKQLSSDEEEQCLYQIMEGNSQLIDKYIESWEYTILSIAKNIQSDQAIELLLEAGRNELHRQVDSIVDKRTLKLFNKLAAFSIKAKMQEAI